MPRDITGNVMFDSKNDALRDAQGARMGVLFTNLLVADEINRAPAKTQAALFEAMQEYQVSLDGKVHPLPRPFMTLATHNPFETKEPIPFPTRRRTVS
jgi:MoxR-like ATPase